MPGAAKPNVVVIYADDLGWGDLPSFGSDDLQTPVLDQLAATGIRLPQWYSNSPVCSPSRASLLTGRYPAHAGVESILGGTRKTPGLPAQETMASELRRRGYRTGIFGKWHLGVAEEYSPMAFGFDESFGFRAGCVDYYSHIYYWGDHNPVHDLWDGDEEVWYNGEYLTTTLGDRATAFIARNADRPFFLYVPFNAPHYPMHAPEEYVARFAHLPEDRRIMAAMIAAMDDAIGAILGALDDHGLREDTLVFFSSDNGPSAESRNWLNGEEVSYAGGSAGGLRGTKGSLFEGGIRVPAILSWPGGLPSGVDHDGVGVMMDVLPTILEAVDGRPADDPGLDGTSLLSRLRAPLVAGGGDARGTTEAADAERSVGWTHDGQWAIRRGDLKLVVRAQEGMTPPHAVDRALYDLARDPAEQTDVAESFPAELTVLEADLEEFQARHRVWSPVDV
ncbi:sulfatase-like hydrolase/transferase [Agromyces aerolatus]|uniref:sulfatase-like hydrolase/transferase n=1 Tax=Agromyces sp. LY-1074 TaxID=3074080 RepID=UPI00285D1D3A|nr:MULTISPECIES: sulfatase-like hydrolase/transferase [unclassified Agromyces]MDR5700811.1 sulfatase-like hydrolase/transferase [Agromyces sp. LY-1074]MDR5707332.1 sulfatase-like hydrolase/transferase [Agromyces sp. LY-1358]